MGTGDRQAIWTGKARVALEMPAFRRIWARCSLTALVSKLIIRKPFTGDAKAAALGRPDAACRMALAYDDPRNTYGVPRNAALAQSWDARASEMSRPLLLQGDADAEYTVGCEMAFGFGLQRDRDPGLDYLLRSADQGNINAQFQLGELVIADHEAEGKALLHKAADHGHSYAMYVLALVDLHGADRDSAKRWLQRSVAFGNPQASQKLRDVFQIETYVPGLGKLPAGPITPEQPGPKDEAMELVTGILVLSLAIGLAAHAANPNPDPGAANREAELMDKWREEDRRRQNRLSMDLQCRMGNLPQPGRKVWNPPRPEIAQAGVKTRK